MISERIPQLQSWSEDDKWQLLIELQEELWHDKDDQERGSAILAELEKRRSHYQAHPETAMSLDEARRKMLSSRP